MANQIRKLVYEAISAWPFIPVLGAIVMYGDVVLTFHDGKLRDVQIPLGGFRMMTKSSG